MKTRKHRIKPIVFALLTATAPGSALAANDTDELRDTVKQLQLQLEQVQQQLDQQQQQSATRKEVQALEKEVAQAAEWLAPNTLVHLAGYADVGYQQSQGDNDDGSFKVGRFAPIFHFQYRDLVMLEAEMEFEVEDDGETSSALEYLTIDLFLNDYTTLVAGKFLSPIGQFRQNIHPTWINKMASPPPGFGHDGAAPVSDIGVQLRGGFPSLAGIRSNYAVFVSNGPTLNAEDGALEGIDAEGFNSDADGDKVFGGRLGILPVPNLEIGLSGATGKVAVNNNDGNSIDINQEGNRDYDVFGADFFYSLRSIGRQWLHGLGLRGEYVKSKIGSTNKGVAASGSANWTTWYTQAAYRFPVSKFEAVIRYTDFDSAVDSGDQKQWGLGVNYLITNSIIAKVNYEFNDGSDSDSAADDNRLVVQLAYGF